MILISHRGNMNGLDPARENTPAYIEEAIQQGYDVEIDIWHHQGGLWLGHDMPQQPTELAWLMRHKERLWVHCKNFMALTTLIAHPLRIFYHAREEYTLLSNGLIWAHNLQETDNKCIIPLLSLADIQAWQPGEVYGICSDYVATLRDHHPHTGR